MEAGFVILIVITALILGIVAGIMITRAKNPDETQGVIYAYYRENENKPSLLLEYSVPIDDIASRKRVVFDVTVIR